MYGSARLDAQLLRTCADELGRLLRRHAGAQTLERTFLSSAGARFEAE